MRESRGGPLVFALLLARMREGSPVFIVSVVRDLSGSTTLKGMVESQGFLRSPRGSLVVTGKYRNEMR
jgi:hypothetical protein